MRKVGFPPALESVTICKMLVGLTIPIPTFPPFELIGAVLVSSSNTPFTIRFHELEVSPEPVFTLSDIVSPVESVAYPTVSTMSVPKKVKAE